MSGGDLLIIGAGPSALALAVHYAGSATVLERSDKVGGLSRSIEIEGGMFDLGGHSFHTPHQEVQDFIQDLMGQNWGTQRRDARVFFNGEFIRYPFQAHYGDLSDAAIVAECSSEGGGEGPSGNFEDWIVGRFGAGIAEHFMLPYNRKLWARDLKRMSCEWVGERVASAGKVEPPSDETRQPLQSNAEVSYPREGGFGAIFVRMAARVERIEFNCDVVEIDAAEKIVRTADGRTFPWRRLASTMPVPQLLKAMTDTPPALQQRADMLELVALRVLMILVDDPLPDAPQRIYVSDPAIPPHKVAFNHTSSEALRRRPVHAIMCEISHSAEKPLASDAELERATVDWLREAKLLPRHVSIARMVHWDVPFGYPVYTHERPAIMAEIRAHLEPRGVHTFGRFGGWHYANSDECIRQGMELARTLSAGSSLA